jgi:hypothetical protein
MKKALIVILTLFSLGCTQQTGQHGEKIRHFKDAWQLYPVSIALNSTSLDFYEAGSALFQTDSSDYFVAYNRKTHALDWFDLSKLEVFHHTKLDYTGPNQILDRVHGLYVHTMDSIFLVDGAFIYLADLHGQVKKRVANSFHTDAGPMTMVPDFTSGLAYRPGSKSLISHAFTPAGKEIVFLEVNLESGETARHTTPVSECYMQTIHLRHNINVFFKGDSIIYNPSCCSDIFVYDMTTQKSSLFNGKSSLGENTVSALFSDHPDARWRHFIENPKFFSLVYSAVDNRYYRLHWKEHEYVSERSKYAAYEKPFIVSVFDANLRLVYEAELSANQFMTGFFIPTSQGVMLNANNPLDTMYSPDRMDLHLWRNVFD